MLKGRFILLGMVLGVLSGFLTPDLIELITRSGHRISSPDLVADYATGVIWGVVIALSIFFWPISSRDKRDLLILWGVRCGVTLGFMLYYEYNYGLDAYSYYNQSRSFVFPWEGVGFGSGTKNIEAISWVLNHFLPINDSYHALKIVFSLFGLIAVYLFYRASVLILEREHRSFLYLLGLFPSLLFWSSILGKDPVHLVGIAIYFYGVLGWAKHQRMKYLLPIALGITFSAWIRLWSGVILISPLFVIGIRRVSNPVLRMVSIVLFSVMLLFSVKLFSQQFGSEISQVVDSTQQLSRAWSRGGSGQEVPEFDSVTSILSFAPKGMFTALFRPFIGEVSNLFGFLAGLENLFLMLALLIAFRRSSLRAFRDPLVVWGATWILVWSFLYGFASYQNLGSAFRFKLQILPTALALAGYLYVNGSLRDRVPLLSRR